MIGLLAATVLGACTAGAAGPAALGGRTFLSVGVTQGGAAKPLVPGTVIRLVFDGNDGIGASAGCNHMGGTYRLQGNVLVFEGGAMTEMGCDEARHKQDDWLFGFLGSKPTVTLAGNDLQLVSGDTTIRLLDREIAEPDLPLVGPTWTVDTILTGDVAVGFGADVAATLKFEADGTFGLFAGCNQGGGTYEVSGGQIRFAAIVLTKRACDGAAGQMEAAVLKILRAETIGWGIDASRLTLQAGPDGLILSGK
ncbi:MAG TPA: META domain-containing protein [Candidatus Limnocylindrales bacterium]